METPLNCSEKCAKMSQLYVLKAFIEKTETKFSIMNLRSYLKRRTLPKILETRKEKEKSTLIIEALKFFFLNKNSSK